MSFMHIRGARGVQDTKIEDKCGKVITKFPLVLLVIHQAIANTTSHGHDHRRYPHPQRGTQYLVPQLAVLDLRLGVAAVLLQPKNYPLLAFRLPCPSCEGSPILLFVVMVHREAGVGRLQFLITGRAPE